MNTNEVLDHTFFKDLEYKEHAILISAAYGKALSITSEAFFDLLDKLLQGT